MLLNPGFLASAVPRQPEFVLGVAFPSVMIGRWTTRRGAWIKKTRFEMEKSAVDEFLELQSDYDTHHSTTALYIAHPLPPFSVLYPLPTSYNLPVSPFSLLPSLPSPHSRVISLLSVPPSIFHAYSSLRNASAAPPVTDALFRSRTFCPHAPLPLLPVHTKTPQPCSITSRTPAASPSVPISPVVDRTARLSHTYPTISYTSRTPPRTSSIL